MSVSKTAHPSASLPERILVTPEMAAEILKGNVGNRPMKRTLVAQLVDSIRRGKWQCTHQGIAIAADGRVLDGQHRLMAVVESGISCWMLVTWGADPATFKVTDVVCVRRTVSDVLQIDRYTAEVARLMATIVLKKSSPAPDEVEPFVVAFADAASRVDSKKIRSISTAGVRAALTLAIAEGNEDHALHIYRSMLRVTLSDAPPIASALYRYLISAGAGGGSVAQTECFLRALYAFTPENAGATKIQIRDVSGWLDRARDRIAAHLLAPGLRKAA